MTSARFRVDKLLSKNRFLYPRLWAVISMSVGFYLLIAGVEAYWETHVITARWLVFFTSGAVIVGAAGATLKAAIRKGKELPTLSDTEREALK